MIIAPLVARTYMIKSPLGRSLGVGQPLGERLCTVCQKFFSRAVHSSAHERICVPESRRTFAAEKGKEARMHPPESY